MFIIHFYVFTTFLMIKVLAIPPAICREEFRWDDCGQPPKPVMYYWKKGSRCEVGLWKGCLPNFNMFADEYECINTCIFSEPLVKRALEITESETEGNGTGDDIKNVTDEHGNTTTGQNETSADNREGNSTTTGNETASTPAGESETSHEPGKETTAAEGDTDTKADDEPTTQE